MSDVSADGETLFMGVWHKDNYDGKQRGQVGAMLKCRFGA